MIDGRRGVLCGKAAWLAMVAVSRGFTLGVVNLPLARAATTSSSASSSGGGMPQSACGAAAERCAADPFCTGCTATIVWRRNKRSRRRLQQQDDDNTDDFDEVSAATELCSSRYPGLVSGPSAPSFCERVGTAKCCEFSNNDAAQACLEDPLSAEYWGCFLMSEVNCDISDMPCHASYGGIITASPTAGPTFVTPSPTLPPTPAPTAAPTAAPTFAPTLAAAITPSPTAGSRGGLGTPTPAPTAVRLDAVDDDASDADAESTSRANARVHDRGRETVLAGAVVAGVTFSSAGALGSPCWNF